MMGRKFTDDEIVKALKCCAPKGNCDECPLNESHFEGELDCVDIITQSALDLINRQKAEIQILNFENLQMIASIKHLKSEAIKEFAERLKEELQLNRTVIGYNGAFVETVQLDNLVKEMTEGKT